MPSIANRLSPAFRRLAFSNLSAQLSEQLALAAAPLAAVLLLGAGPAETGYLQTAQTLPFLLFSMIAGVLADRTSRRRLMVAAEAVRAVSLAAVLVLLVEGVLNLPLLAGLGFLGAVGTVAYSVAAPALVPALVPRAGLGPANRWLELARSLAFAGGPALGGLIVGGTGAPLAYAVATVLSLLAVALLAGLPEPSANRGARRAVLQEMKEGAAFVLTHPLLRPVLVTAVFFNTAWFVLQAVYVAYAMASLGLSPAGVGATLGAYGAGMVAGALLAGWLGERLSFGAMIAIGPAAGLLASLLMLATLGLRSGTLAGVSFFLFGAGPILWTITTTTLRQAVTPGGMLGRVSAVVMTASFGARPVGAAIGALLAAHWGVAAPLWVSAAGFLVQFLVLFGSPIRHLARQPEAAQA
ncbi:MFS transporter [Roseomonas sp. KE2513]|uniref:MFS transporter n=1 Tax=Roseomonas sp. KE2513 TaxID=2479202 RepID=UPI0028149929|nr:MFS transporter [Roseomonas sp. KE2513]MBI0536263.1 MFS transporter [Roseomonas sp. KE2513]